MVCGGFHSKTMADPKWLKEKRRSTRNQTVQTQFVAHFGSSDKSLMAIEQAHHTNLFESFDAETEEEEKELNKK